MRIAIHSLPRCGTKTLQRNFQSYLKALGMPVLGANRVDGLGEPFIFTEKEFTTGITNQRLKKYDADGPIFETGDPISVYQELSYRFVNLIHRKRNFVFKRNPLIWGDPLIYDTITNIDKCISVIREDTFDHCLSFCIAHYLQIWNKGDELNNAIIEHSKNKIRIDPDIFLLRYNTFSLYKKLKWTAHFQIVKFDDIIKISSAKEFCEFFNLRYYHFEFKTFEIEYGDNKFNMIENLDELKKLVQTV